MRIETLALLVVAVSLPVLACTDLGCTEIGCESQVVLHLPAPYAATSDAAQEFCQGVSGTLTIDDMTWAIEPGQWPDISTEERRWLVDCGFPGPFELVERGAAVTLDLGYRAGFTVSLDVVDRNGARFVVTEGEVAYTRSQPNGPDCGPVCQVGTGAIRRAEP